MFCPLPGFLWIWSVWWMPYQIFRDPQVQRSKTIHRRQPLNAVYLAAPCVYLCCVLCVLKQWRGGNAQLRLCLWMGRLCSSRVIFFWTVALWGPQACAEHPWVHHHCQAVPFVSRCAGRILARDGSIKTIFPNLTWGSSLQPWVASLWDGKFRIADAPSISSSWSVVVMGWQPWGELGGFGGLGVSPLFQTGGAA